MSILTQNSLSLIYEQLIQAGKTLSSKGLLPATSGNLSMRDLQTGAIYISVSGKCKGQLNSNDFIEINTSGIPLNPNAAKPSAETLLHTQLYKFSKEINAVFHIHSVNSVVISKLFADQHELKLKDYELLKGLSSISTHRHTETIPIFANTQNIQQLAIEVDQYMKTNPEIHAYLIEGHGLYSWGSTAAEALRHIEVFETLFEIERALWH